MKKYLLLLVIISLSSCLNMGNIIKEKQDIKNDLNSNIISENIPDNKSNTDSYENNLTKNDLVDDEKIIISNNQSSYDNKISNDNHIEKSINDDKSVIINENKDIEKKEILTNINSTDISNKNNDDKLNEVDNNNESNRSNDYLEIKNPESEFYTIDRNDIEKSKDSINTNEVVHNTKQDTLLSKQELSNIKDEQNFDTINYQDKLKQYYFNKLNNNELSNKSNANSTNELEILEKKDDKLIQNDKTNKNQKNTPQNKNNIKKLDDTKDKKNSQINGSNKNDEKIVFIFDDSNKNNDLSNNLVTYYYNDMVDDKSNFQVDYMKENYTDNSPIFEKISVLENTQFNIVLDKDGWLIQSNTGFSVKPLRRENNSSKTNFLFTSINAGNSEVKFVRYDYDSNTYISKLYYITVNPKTVESDKKSSKKVEKKKKDDKPDYRKELADNNFNASNYSEAIRYYEDYAKDSGFDYEIYYKLGRAYYEIANIQKSKIALMNNLKEEGNPFYDDSLIYYLNILKNEKKYDDGIDAIYKLGLTSGVNKKTKELLYLMLGDFHYNLNNFKQSLSSYKAFISLYPLSSFIDKAYFYAAYSIEQLDNPNYKEAITYYETIINNYPESKYVNLSKSRINNINRHYLKVN